MAVAIYVHPKSLNQQQYEETRRRLADAGQESPEGRVHHSCFGEGDSLMVYDVWESRAQFDTFGQTMLPILGDMGIEMGEPMIMPIVDMKQ